MRACISCLCLLTFALAVQATHLKTKWEAAAGLKNPDQGDHVFFKTLDNQIGVHNFTHLRLLDAVTGSQQWIVQVPEVNKLAFEAAYASADSVFIHVTNNVVIGQDYIYRYSTADGTLKAKAGPLGAYITTGFTESLKSFFVITGEPNGQPYHLARFDTESGELIFNRSISAQGQVRGSILYQASFHDDIVSVNCDDEGTNGAEYHVYQFDAATGDFLCKFKGELWPRAGAGIFGTSGKKDGTILYNAKTCSVVKSYPYSLMQEQSGNLRGSNWFYALNVSQSSTTVEAISLTAGTRGTVETWTSAPLMQGTRDSFFANFVSVDLMPETLLVSYGQRFFFLDKKTGAVDWDSKIILPSLAPNGPYVYPLDVANGLVFIANLQGYLVYDTKQNKVLERNEVTPIDPVGRGPFQFVDPTSQQPFVVFWDLHKASFVAVELAA